MRATTRALLPLALALLATLTPPAQADEVSRAKAQVDALQDLARESTETLLAGTRQWEADQLALRRTRTRLESTRRHVREAAAAVAAEQAHVAAVARSLYMSPTPAGVQLAFTRTRDEVFDTLRAHASLDQAAGSQAQVVHRAAVARHRLAREEQKVRSLERAAAQLVASSARRLAQLQALAASTADRLDAAQDALSRARAAKEAREQAARERAARERAARAASRTGATCQRRSTAGQQNGNLDPASLCPLWRAPGHRLRYDAADAFNAMSKYHAATRGRPLCVTDSYRSYSEQVDVYRRKPGLAAVPGTSEHGWGKAVDLGCGVQNSGSAAYQWMKANAGRFGWFHPDWAEPGGSKPEAWHWEFSG